MQSASHNEGAHGEITKKKKKKKKMHSTESCETNLQSAVIQSAVIFLQKVIYTDNCSMVRQF